MKRSSWLAIIFAAALAGCGTEEAVLGTGQRLDAGPGAGTDGPWCPLTIARCDGGAPSPPPCTPADCAGQPSKVCVSGVATCERDRGGSCVWNACH